MGESKRWPNQDERLKTRGLGPTSASWSRGTTSTAQLHHATNGRDQYQALRQAESRRYVLDNATVAEVTRAYGATKSYLWLYDTQLARWGRDDLTSTQRAEVMRLKDQMAALHGVVDAVLALAERLTGQTIEALLAKREPETGVDWLLGGDDR